MRFVSEADLFEIILNQVLSEIAHQVVRLWHPEAPLYRTDAKYFLCLSFILEHAHL